MAQQAGQYDCRFQLLQCTRTADGTTGDKPKTYLSVGYVWGSVDLESASIANRYGAERAQGTGTIRLRNLPVITTLDRLYSPALDTTYTIDGLRRDYRANETILDVSTLEID